MMRAMKCVNGFFKRTAKLCYEELWRQLTSGEASETNVMEVRKRAAFDESICLKLGDSFGSPPIICHHTHTTRSTSTSTFLLMKMLILLLSLMRQLLQPNCKVE